MITPTSSVARAVAAAKILVATSPTFIQRQLDHGVDVRLPSDRVFMYDAHSAILTKPIPELRPLCVVGCSESIDFEPLNASCKNINLVIGGGIYVVITDNARKTDTDTIAQEDTVIAGIYADAYAGAYATEETALAGEVLYNANRYDDTYVDFLNFVYGICDDMHGVFGGDNDLIGFKGIETVTPPMRTEIDERQDDDHWYAVLRFQYGDV